MVDGYTKAPCFPINLFAFASILTMYRKTGRPCAASKRLSNLDSNQVDIWISAHRIDII